MPESGINRVAEQWPHWRGVAGVVGRFVPEGVSAAGVAGFDDDEVGPACIEKGAGEAELGSPPIRIGAAIALLHLQFLEHTAGGAVEGLRIGTAVGDGVGPKEIGQVVGGMSAGGVIGFVAGGAERVGLASEDVNVDVRGGQELRGNQEQGEKVDDRATEHRFWF